MRGGRERRPGGVGGATAAGSRLGRAGGVAVVVPRAVAIGAVRPDRGACLGHAPTVVVVWLN